MDQATRPLDYCATTRDNVGHLELGQQDSHPQLAQEFERQCAPPAAGIADVECMAGQHAIEFRVFGRHIRIVVDVSRSVVRDAMTTMSMPTAAGPAADQHQVLGVSRMLEYYAGLDEDEVQAAKEGIARDAKIIREQRALHSMRYRAG